jgi:hypothetical protein
MTRCKLLRGNFWEKKIFFLNRAFFEKLSNFNILSQWFRFKFISDPELSGAGMIFSKCTAKSFGSNRVKVHNTGVFSVLLSRNLKKKRNPRASSPSPNKCKRDLMLLFVASICYLVSSPASHNLLLYHTMKTHIGSIYVFLKVVNNMQMSSIGRLLLPPTFQSTDFLLFYRR